MAIAAIIYGASGSGKSSSMRNFSEGEIGLVNVLGKPLPFRTKLPSISTTNYDSIKTAIRNSRAKSIVIDDAGYLITDMFMTRHSSTGKGNAVFSLYNDIGDAYYDLLRFIGTLDSADDKIVYLVMHEDFDDFGNSKIRTIGKLLDEKILLPGMVSILLHACVRDGDYVFEVNGDGICKSPEGMFETLTVPNDLKAVDTAIRTYWDMSALNSGGIRNDTD